MESRLQNCKCVSVHVIECAVLIAFVKHLTVKCLLDGKPISSIGKLGNPTQTGKLDLLMLKY